MNWLAVGLTLVTIIVAAPFFFRRPDWGLAALLVTLPLERIGAYPLSRSGFNVVRPAEVAAAALILAAGARLMAGRDRLKLPASWPWLAAFAASALISAALIHHPRIWQNYLTVLFFFATLAVVAQIVRRAHLKLLRQALLAGAIAASLFGLYQFFSDIAGLSSNITGIRAAYSKSVLGFPRLQSTATEPGYLANYLLLPLLVGLTLLTDRRLKPWEISGLTIVGLALILTASRGAILAALPALGLLVVWRFKLKPLSPQTIKRVGVAGAAILISGVLLFGVASVSAGRSFSAGPRLVAELFTSKLTTTSSYGERAAGRGPALKVWRQSPVFGVGPGRFQTIGADYPAARHGYDRLIFNNAWLALLVEVGLIGFLLFAGFVVSLFVKAWKRRGDPWIFGLAVALVAILIQAATLASINLLWIWAALGLLAGLLNGKEPSAQALA